MGRPIAAPVTYVDATNLTRKHRRPFIKIAQHMGCRCEAVYFNLSLEECLRRNAMRRRQVPEDAIRTLAERLQVPEITEGFDAVLIVAP